jgi:glycerol-3-phosphate dehydrogenase
VEMPIVAAVSAIIDLGADPADEIAKLLARPVRDEIR